MMDRFIYGDIVYDVKKRCKKSKKHIFDTSWKVKYNEVMQRSLTDIYYFIRHGDSN